jgi:APA family basic amino acid/polyamine antiporter
MRAMGLGTGIVMLLYLGLNAVFVYGAPADALAGRPEVGAIAAEALGGPGLRSAVSLLVALALFTSISSMVMTGPRVYARMADDGWLPALFASEADVPRAAVALQIVLAIVVIWLSGLVALLGYIGFTLGLSAAATVIGLLRLRHREGAAQVPIPGYPFVPAIFLVGTLGAALFMVVREPLPSLAGLATVATGLPFYWWRRRSRAVTPAL